jgi:hypothetical protein
MAIDIAVLPTIPETRVILSAGKNVYKIYHATRLGLRGEN